MVRSGLIQSAGGRGAGEELEADGGWRGEARGDGRRQRELEEMARRNELEEMVASA